MFIRFCVYVPTMVKKEETEFGRRDEHREPGERIQLQTIHLIFIYFGRSFILLQCKHFDLTNLNKYTENTHIFTKKIKRFSSFLNILMVGYCQPDTT